MSDHSIIEAEHNLLALIERARKGEDVLITLDGEPVAELKAITKKPQPRRITQADVDWLVAHRVSRKRVTKDAGTLLSEMRDQDWR